MERTICLSLIQDAVFERAVSSATAILFLLLLSSLTLGNVYQVGETFRDCVTCPEMVVLPAGEFTMGSPEDEKGRWSDEGPQHQVTIPKPFAVGKYEVTVGQFAQFIKETNYTVGHCIDDPKDGVWSDPPVDKWPESRDLSWHNPNIQQSNNHPVVCVSWGDASTYAYWLSAKTGNEYRLLTEAEWEYAARGGTMMPYHFGHMVLSSIANYNGNEKGSVTVGSYPANAFGLHDMHGNVWEWVEDCTHNDYIGAPTNGGAWLSECEEENDFRIVRGGSWINSPEYLRSATRFKNYISGRDNVFGFRIARTLTP